MEEVEEGVVFVTGNETYSQIVEFDDLEHPHIPPPPSLPPPAPLLSLPSSSAADVIDAEEEEKEEKDDFVQRNPLAQLQDDEEESEHRTHEAVDTHTIQPQVVTTPIGYEVLSPGTKENSSSDDVHKAQTGVGYTSLDTTVHAQYGARYMGSIRLPEGDLVGERCTATLTDCITNVSKKSKKANKVIYEFKENQKVILRLEERELKLTTDEKNANIISCHLFRKIRAWAVGKENDSHHFAYVIRSPDENAGYSYVCRVFKCNAKAREVATAIRNICQRRAAMRADSNH